MLRSDEPDSDEAISSSRRLRRMRRRGLRVKASNSARSFLVNCIVSPFAAREETRLVKNQIPEANILRFAHCWLR